LHTKAPDQCLVSWNKIRALGEVKYFGLSYVVLAGVPVLSSLFANAEALPILGSILAEFPLGFKLVYIASLFYAVGIALYQFLCPDEVKRFSRDFDYVRSDLQIAQQTNPTFKLQIVLTQLESLSQEYKNRITSLYTASRLESGPPETSSELTELVDDIYPSCVQQFLIQEYNTKNCSFPFARWISAVCYLFGTLILICLLIIKSYSVIVE
jgi:hypothetical protein